MRRKKPGDSKPEKYMVQWSAPIEAKPIVVPPRPELPPKPKERITLKVKQAWFSHPLNSIKGSPSYIGSGPEWDHVLLLAKEDYIEIQYEELSLPDKPTRVVCVPYSSVRSFELSPATPA